MTLIELIVTITVIGAIATVLAAAVTVTFRQHADTEGNLSVARWEQALALYLPTDLASADSSTLDTDPDAPAGCGSPCAGSSNAFSVVFDDGSGPTTVSYRYGPAPDGADDYVMTRIECKAGSCTSRVILRDLAAPSDPAWVAGVSPAPTSVITVAAPSEVGDDGVDDLRATTVSVTVNGVSDAGGADRSSTVSLTAGGVVQPELELPTFEGPSFVDARSGCGGPVTLIVDDSQSVGDDGVIDIRRGVESFVRAFEGTPTDLKVVRFSTHATTLGGGWDTTFDLSEPADVFALVGDATEGEGGFLGEIVKGGTTDWKEALERAYLSDVMTVDEDGYDVGIPYRDLGDPNRPAPELVVFFTDGVPSTDDGLGATAPEYPDFEQNDKDDAGNIIKYKMETFVDDPLASPDGKKWVLDLEAWYRVWDLMSDFRDDGRLIGVGIGTAFSGTTYLPPHLAGWATHDPPPPVFLGSLVVGAPLPNTYTHSGGYGFEVAEYDSAAGEWGDVSTADILTTPDLSALGSGLAAIALAECGGTLTVQTRDGGGLSADEDVSYAMGNEQVTTTRVVKAATFDVPFGGTSSKTVQLVPQSLDGTGYVATGWVCKSKGVGFPFSMLTADPADGIELTVTPNGAVSCTMSVS